LNTTMRIYSQREGLFIPRGSGGQSPSLGTASWSGGKGVRGEGEQRRTRWCGAATRRAIPPRLGPSQQGLHSGAFTAPDGGLSQRFTAGPSQAVPSQLSTAAVASGSRRAPWMGWPALRCPSLSLQTLGRLVWASSPHGNRSREGGRAQGSRALPQPRPCQSVQGRGVRWGGEISKGGHQWGVSTLEQAPRVLGQISVTSCNISVTSPQRLCGVFVAPLKRLWGGRR